jgi:hypothetical protein
VAGLARERKKLGGLGLAVSQPERVAQDHADLGTLASLVRDGLRGESSFDARRDQDAHLLDAGIVPVNHGLLGHRSTSSQGMYRGMKKAAREAAYERTKPLVFFAKAKGPERAYHK